MGYNINWLSWLHCMGPPHIYSRHGRGHPSILHLSHYNYCHPYRGKSLQLTSHPSWRQHQVIPRYALSPRLYFPFYSRWTNRNRPSQLISRYCPSRHILRCSTLSLRPIYRGCICYYRRLRPLIPTILRLHIKHNLSKNSFPNYIRRC